MALGAVLALGMFVKPTVPWFQRELECGSVFSQGAYYHYPDCAKALAPTKQRMLLIGVIGIPLGLGMVWAGGGFTGKTTLGPSVSQDTPSP